MNCASVIISLAWETKMTTGQSAEKGQNRHRSYSKPLVLGTDNIVKYEFVVHKEANQKFERYT